MKQNRDIVLFYLFRFLIGFYIANGTTILFAQELGFSYTRIFTLTAVYMLMFIVFEVPSGAFADLLGRKRTVIIGAASIALGAVATGLSSTFPQVFASYLLWAFGFSMMSGADEALLYDRLKDDSVYARVVGKSYFFALIGTALAGVLGPYLYSLNFRFAYLASAVPFALGALALAFFREEFVKKDFTIKAHLDQIKTGAKFAFNNKFVLWAMVAMAIVFGVAYTFSNFYQPYLRQIGFSVRAFSIILPIMFLVEAFGGNFSGKLYAFFGENKILSSSLLLTALAVGGLGFIAVKSSLAIIYALTFFQGILRPVLSTYSNKHIESSHRATVISVQGMIATITASAMLFLFGFLTDRVGLNMVLMILGGGLLAAAIVLLFFKPRNRSEP